MRIKCKVLSTNTINYNGEFVDVKSLRNAIDTYIKNNFITGYFGLFYYGGKDLEDCAGKIYNLWIDNDGIFMFEGDTIDTPKGKMLEDAIHNNMHLSIAMDGYYRYDAESDKEVIERIIKFIIQERTEPNEEWEVQEVKTEKVNTNMKTEKNELKADWSSELAEDVKTFNNDEDIFNYEVSDNNRIPEEEMPENKFDKPVKVEDCWWYYMETKDIETILRLSEKVLNQHSKKECLNMTKDDYYQEILDGFIDKKEGMY